MAQVSPSPLLDFGKKKKDVFVHFEKATLEKIIKIKRIICDFFSLFKKFHDNVSEEKRCSKLLFGFNPKELFFLLFRFLKSALTHSFTYKIHVRKIHLNIFI